MFDLMRRQGETRIGLVTPYTKDVQRAILEGFAREGVRIVGERP
jgi:maleate isomerase